MIVLQIQATDKTFAETREKTQKLLEEEKKKSMKDMSRRGRDERPIVRRQPPTTNRPNDINASKRSELYSKKVKNLSIIIDLVLFLFKIICFFYQMDKNSKWSNASICCLEESKMKRIVFVCD